MSTITDRADHRPRYTAADLLAEARANRTMQHHEIPIAQFLLDLPGMLTKVVDIILAEVDYQQSKRTNIAMGLRCLAAITVSLDDQLERLAQR